MTTRRALHEADARFARRAAFVAASGGRGWAMAEDTGEKQKQIPFGNDNQNSKNKSTGKGSGSAWLTTDR